MAETLITAAVAIIVCVLTHHFQMKQIEEKQDLQKQEMQEAQKETISLISYKLEQLEKKQDLHNNAIVRLYEVEKRLGIDEERIKVANNRIKDLEEGK